MTATGPSIRAVCRIINQNSCGSGSICGIDGNDAFVLTNAHVAGSRVGRDVIVEVESLNSRRFTGTVIRAAYSNSVSADWALLRVPGLTEIKPVYLSRDLPARRESMYTKGFPKCRAHNGTDITQYKTLNNGVLLWSPDAIGGQSGSGVWGDGDNLQKALLTWSMRVDGRWRGAGQLTAEIWAQNRDFILGRSLRGAVRMPDVEYKEINDFDFQDIDRTGATDPEVFETFSGEPIQRGIQDYPIWAHMFDNPAPPSDPDNGDHLESLKRIRDKQQLALDQTEMEIARYEAGEIVDPSDDDLTFGL